MTVADLITVLRKLPPKTEIWISWWGGEDAANIAALGLNVYRKDGVTKLYFDDKEATHPALEPYCVPILDVQQDIREVADG